MPHHPGSSVLQGIHAPRQRGDPLVIEKRPRTVRKWMRTPQLSQLCLGKSIQLSRYIISDQRGVTDSNQQCPYRDMRLRASSSLQRSREHANVKAKRSLHQSSLFLLRAPLVENTARAFLGGHRSAAVPERPQAHLLCSSSRHFLKR